jgi:hypothetical protein
MNNMKINYTIDTSKCIEDLVRDVTRHILADKVQDGIDSLINSVNDNYLQLLGKAESMTGETETVTYIFKFKQ